MDSPAAEQRRRDLRSAIRLEYVTLAWMTIEFGSSIILGLISGSLLLLAFGIDSLIELLSAVVVLRRLRWESGGTADQQRVGRMERRTARLTGYLLFALAAYVVASAIYGLVAGRKMDVAESTWGLLIAAVALVGMPVLAHYKRKLAAPGRLDSPSLRADAAEAVSCAYLSAVLLVGLALARIPGWWWVDSVAALALIPFVVVEGREALRTETEER
jgi:divalent metal cation (Fe/Co/Zn/Cd) transporter